MMKRHILTGTALAAAALLLAACSGGAGTDPTADQAKKITIGIKYDQPGLGLQEGGEYTGFDVDVAKYVAGQLGYPEESITFKETPSAQRENMLSSGQVDMIFATYSITDERKEKVSFGGPYFVAGQDLLVAEDNTDITGPDTLAGKKLCSVTGSTPAQRIKDEHSADVQLQEYDTYSKCVEALGTGAVDAVTTDDIILAGYAAQPQNVGKMKVVGKPFSEERYGVGLKKDSPMCGQVNTAIQKMIKDGTWQKLLDKNMGATGYRPNAQVNPPTTFGTCG